MADSPWQESSERPLPLHSANQRIEGMVELGAAVSGGADGRTLVRGRVQGDDIDIVRYTSLW